MNTKELNEFKVKFLLEKQEIKNKLNEIEDLDTEGDNIDIAAGNALRKMKESLSMRQLIKIRRIDAALKRIESGTFGECEECGKDINEKRLNAKPDATTCICCAEQLEIKAKQFA